MQIIGDGKASAAAIAEQYPGLSSHKIAIFIKTKLMNTYVVVCERARYYRANGYQNNASKRIYKLTPMGLVWVEKYDDKWSEDN